MNDKEQKQLHPKTKKVLDISKKRKQKTLTNSQCDQIEILNSTGSQTNNTPNNKI